MYISTCHLRCLNTSSLKRENSPDDVTSSMDILVYSRVDKVTKIQSKVSDKILSSLVERRLGLEYSSAHIASVGHLHLMP